MVNIDEFRAFALSFENVIEKPHFERTSYTINNKIFATLDTKKNIGCVKLSTDLQNEYSSIQTYIYPVEGHWGNLGWTYINLQKATEEITIEVLAQAHHLISLKKNRK